MYYVPLSQSRIELLQAAKTAELRDGSVDRAVRDAAGENHHLIHKLVDLGLFRWGTDSAGKELEPREVELTDAEREHSVA